MSISKRFARWILNEASVVTMSAPPPRQELIVRQPIGLATVPEITITRPPEKVPELARVYRASFSWGRVCWSIESCSYRSRCNDSLMRVAQQNGHEIYVWSTRIADELVVPHVVKDVEAFVAAVKELDAAFMATDDSRQFVDEKGHAWRRIG